jgi:SAM-dependent methyltransferase
MNNQLIKEESQFFPSEASVMRALSLAECLRRRLLISPDTKKELVESKEGEFLEDKQNRYILKNGCPMLYPKEISDILLDGGMPLDYSASPLQQYVLLSQIKQSGEINAPLDSVPARKHQFRFKDFCKGLTGLVLDVGSDKPSHSMQFLPPECEYLGLDPYAGDGEFRLIGLGEILPINHSCVDAVLFNTSLDHMLDYHTAIEEACRVLRLGGRIVIATYAWIEDASLLADSIHFHHFREFEIFGALNKHFEIEDVRRYEDPKHANHRYGLYVMAKRR